MAAKPVVVDPVIETPVHHHTDACYEEVLVCGLPEHHHTVNCLSDRWTARRTRTNGWHRPAPR